MRQTFAYMCVIGLLVLSTCAWASMSGPLTVTATSNGRIATWTYNWLPGQMNYSCEAPIELRSGDNTLLGSILSLNCGMQSDPVLTLDFAVEAVGNTNFTFDTGNMLFPVINGAEAFATAATTLTADGNGASFDGNFAGNNGYQATYNGGTVFAVLDPSFTSPPNTSTVETGREPAVGFEAIGVPVSSMRAQWDFNLSGGDQASGTSRYEIEPVPDASTLALAFAGAAPLLAGFAIRRRRTS